MWHGICSKIPFMFTPAGSPVHARPFAHLFANVVGLVMRGQITSRLITINLVSDNVCHGLILKALL